MKDKFGNMAMDQANALAALMAQIHQDPEADREKIKKAADKGTTFLSNSKLFEHLIFQNAILILILICLVFVNFSKFVVGSDLCHLHLAGFCPHVLLKGTKVGRDLGVCLKHHDERLQEIYQE